MQKAISRVLLFFVIISCNSEKKQTSAVFSDTEDATFSTITNLVDYFAEENLSKGNASAFAVAIYRDGNMYQNYYGALNRDSKEKLNDNSLFEIASITKTFTGSLVAKAVLSGKLNLEDDIRKYLDNDYPNLEYEGQPITIQHLLTHSLGFKIKTPPRLEEFNKKMNSVDSLENFELYTIDDLLEELKSVELDKKPGTVYEYTSIGPELLAYILEQVNNLSFKNQLKVFLDELDMNNTYLNESEKHLDNLVRGYDGNKLAPVDYCPIYGAAGGAISILPDLAKYMKYLVDNKEMPWIRESSRSLFVDKEDDENIGYLWQNIGYAEEEGYYYSKTGTSNGTQSIVLICPDSNYGMVVLVNNTSDEAMNDWVNLTFRDIEPMLIKYPKLSLTALYKRDFSVNPDKAIENFRTFKNDTINYTYSIQNLNNFGYDLLNEKQHESAIKVFQFLTSEFPDNGNLFDSLGEAYFLSEDYNNAINSFTKALKKDPNLETSKDYINKIEDIISE